MLLGLALLNLEKLLLLMVRLTDIQSMTVNTLSLLKNHLDQEFLYPTRRLQASMLFQWLLMVKSLKLRFPERPDILKDNKLHLRSITKYSKFNSNNNSKEKKLRKLM